MGVLFFILCCGRYPFSGDSDGEVLEKIQAGKFSIPKSSNVATAAKSLVRPFGSHTDGVNLLTPTPPPIHPVWWVSLILSTDPYADGD